MSENCNIYIIKHRAKTMRLNKLGCDLKWRLPEILSLFVLIKMLVLCSVLSHCSAASLVVDTFAGTGYLGTTGDGGDATAAMLNNPRAVWGDSVGAVYIAEKSNSCVRKVFTDNILIDFAGDCGSSSSGTEGIQATSSRLSNPGSIVGDTSGVIYIGDTSSNKVRVVATNGIINLFAGVGGTSNTGDGGPATSAGIYGPTSLFLTTQGVMYVVCNSADQLRSISSNIVNLIAG